jgi:hypothetical protein
MRLARLLVVAAAAAAAGCGTAPTAVPERLPQLDSILGTPVPPPPLECENGVLEVQEDGSLRRVCSPSMGSGG